MRRTGLIAGRGGTAAAWAVGLLLAFGLPASPALAAGDANTSFCSSATESSAGFHASLPDCRAYELVTQANTGNQSSISETYGFPDHFMYVSELLTPGEGAGSGLREVFVASRTANGWQQTPLSVPQGEAQRQISFGASSDAEGMMFTGDFADALVMSPYQDALETPRLDETLGTMVYEISLSNGAISTVSLPDSGKLTQSMIEFPASLAGRASSNGWGMYLAGASEDGSRIFFSTTAKLATAPGMPQDTHQTSAEVYERSGGHTYLVGVLPNGEVPVCGAEVGQNENSTVIGAGQLDYGSGAIAPDGSNVVFHAPGEYPEAACTEKESGIFLRDVVNGSTVKLPGEFYAGRTGTGLGEEEKIFTFETGRRAIFEYHVTTKQTVEIASETQGLLAYSANGSRVYYLGPEYGVFLHEEGVPTPTLVPGTQKGDYGIGHSEISTGAELRTSGATQGSTVDNNAPMVTHDGNYFIFLDEDQLTSYNNCSNYCHSEVYLYDAATDGVTCLSCGPAGVAPQGDASLLPDKWGAGKSRDFVPSAPPLVDSRPAEAGTEAVMRVVFQTTEGLVPQDTNGAMDVYEWEQGETEGCSRASLKLASLKESAHYSEADGGCLYLLTGGMGVEPQSGGSRLRGASKGLADIYIETVEPLLQGVDSTAHVYDVRQGGGFPYAAPAQKGCEPGQCRAEVEGPPLFGAPASAGLTGVDNLTPAIAKPMHKAGLTSRQKLARALKACKRLKNRHKRTACERKARGRYGAKVRRKTHHGRRGGSK
jgi:hypothetical protein